MGQRQKYSREFRDAITAKILNRGNRSIAEVCEEEGVGLSAATIDPATHWECFVMKAKALPKFFLLRAVELVMGI